jgi:CBS domain containing-hemolysin-like protein
VGEIKDEYDMDEDKPILKQEDGSYLIEANVPLDDVNETLGVHLTPKGDVTSLGGYLTEKAGKVPKKGKVIDEYETTTTIVDGDDKKIIKVKMIKKNVPYPPLEEEKPLPKPRKRRTKPPAGEVAEVPQENETR